MKIGEKYLIANCTLGLCNRLKCLISAMRYAEKLSRTLVLCWPKNLYVHCNFSDLFENKIIEITPEELKIFRSRKDIDEKYQILSTWRLLTFPEDNLSRKFSQIYRSETGRNIDCEYNRIPSSIREQYLQYINRLIPKRQIVKEVEVFSETFNADTISVSIRTWVGSPERACLFSLNNVFNLLDTVNNANFFVSCDSQEILEKMIVRYGKRIIFNSKRTYTGDRKTADGMQDTLCNLLLLSKNKKMLVSYLSTFPEMAWWFGGCQADVSIIPPKTWFFKIVPLERPQAIWCVLYKWYNSLPLFSYCTTKLYKMYKYYSNSTD